ncbi:hypothetical protein R3P38DRAFT_2936684 [Favolaschia claudopus]|uniref:Glycoprotein n=1 Tax=Favolaschia claudopus TaxID=2862362 RepID=A0AAW0BPG9_9AGAR
MVLFTGFAVVLGALALPAAAQSAFPGVIATGTNGPTNPPRPTAPTLINQTSMARLITLNSVDDFCLFAPPEGPALIGDTETEEVAWCTKPRNNARVIPDGTITGVTFLKTPFYVQIMGIGNFTNLNIRAGDDGGELDPHGAQGSGNPIGGNVTTNIVNGVDDVFYEEWMMFISANRFCVRACTNANSTYAAKYMCEHKLDVMGCDFVMPGTYHPAGTFESCEADVAYPPGWYPTATVSGSTLFSTFAQYWTGVVGDQTFTVGDLVTPTAPATIPSSSNCATVSTIANGIALASLTAGAIGTEIPTVSTGSSGSGSPTSSGGSGGSGPSQSAPPNAALHGAHVGFRSMGEFAGIVVVSLVSGLAAIAMLH